VAGYLLWQVFWKLVAPALGVMAGFLLVAGKVVFLVLLVLVALWIFKRLSRRAEAH
jgi:flagellar biogenesis protein FliO